METDNDGRFAYHRPNDARFADCRPRLRLRKKGTKFDIYQCAACKKIWSIPKYKLQRSES